MMKIRCITKQKTFAIYIMNYYYHQNGNHNNKQTIALTLTTLSTIITTYYLGKSIHKYGLNGTLRLIWEGDHLTPDVREAVDMLDSLGSKIKKNKKKLEKIEVMVEVEKLNSVDDGQSSNNNYKNNNDNDGDSNSNNIVEDSITTSLTPSPLLSKELSMLSYTLDKLAADIDSVKSCNDIEVKRRKKEFSKMLVSMMEVVDSFFKECGIES